MNNKHGLAHSRIDRIYKSMKERCYKTYNNRYKNYGAKGIKICDEWLEDKRNFFEWAYKNGYRNDLTIDRINVNGNYEPSNCRWATYKEQNNNRSNNKYISHKGETKTMMEWSEVYGVSYKALHKHLKNGESFETAITYLIGKTS